MIKTTLLLKQFPLAATRALRDSTIFCYLPTEDVERSDSDLCMLNSDQDESLTAHSITSK